ncbi:MAG TPA: DUF4328 domain-containing protein [Pseudonocardiaceae bacterium]
MTYMGRGRRVNWVASRPPGVETPRQDPRQADYAGPPAYQAIPRWGLPRLAWRRPTVVPGGTGAPPRRITGLARQARLAVSACALLALADLLAGGGEIWRFTLLVIGQDNALSPDVVTVSDALVNTGAVLAMVTGLVALVLVVRWLLTARSAAARATGLRPARGDGQALAGVLIPGWNLVMAGSIAAELEHAAQGGSGGGSGSGGTDGSGRVRPSPPVLAWWMTFVLGELLAITTMIWGLWTGVAALAYGVLWHAATDLVAAAVAVLTGWLVASITRLLAPAGLASFPFWRVVRIDTATDTATDTAAGDTDTAGGAAGDGRAPARRPRPTGAVR